MKTLISSSIACLLLARSLVLAGSESELITPQSVDTDRWRIGLESGVLFGLNNPNDYVLAPVYLHLDYRVWEPLQLGQSDWMMTAPLVLIGGLIPIINGPESLWAGGALGMKLELSKAGYPLSFFVRLQGGLGAIDSRGVPDGQGQDFTFTVIAAAGAEYRLNDTWSFSLAVLYQHISNGNLSEPEFPNIGLDSIGPVISFSKKF